MSEVRPITLFRRRSLGRFTEKRRSRGPSRDELLAWQIHLAAIRPQVRFSGEVRSCHEPAITSKTFEQRSG
jgi:hypothetical protein